MKADGGAEALKHEIGESRDTQLNAVRKADAMTDNAGHTGVTPILRMGCGCALKSGIIRTRIGGFFP